MADDRWALQVLDGYTDGRQSWMKVHVGAIAASSKEGALAEAARRQQEDGRTYRVRKAPVRRREREARG